MSANHICNRMALCLVMLTAAPAAQQWDVDNQGPPAVGADRQRTPTRPPSLDYPCTLLITGDSSRIAVELRVHERQPGPVACTFNSYDTLVIGTITVGERAARPTKNTATIAAESDHLRLKLCYLSDTAVYRIVRSDTGWHPLTIRPQPFATLACDEPVSRKATSRDHPAASDSGHGSRTGLPDHTREGDR
jgi:hypothetical protein